MISFKPLFFLLGLAISWTAAIVLPPLNSNFFVPFFFGLTFGWVLNELWDVRRQLVQRAHVLLKRKERHRRVL